MPMFPNVLFKTFKQCFQDDVSITMDFINHVLTEIMEVYPTSKLYRKSNKIYHSFQHFNWMRCFELKEKPQVFSELGHINLKSLASARIRGFSGKTPKRTWLCSGISPVRYALQTW